MGARSRGQRLKALPQRESTAVPLPRAHPVQDSSSPKDGREEKSPIRRASLQELCGPGTMCDTAAQLQPERLPDVQPVLCCPGACVFPAEVPLHHPEESWRSSASLSSHPAHSGQVKPEQKQTGISFPLLDAGEDPGMVLPSALKQNGGFRARSDANLNALGVVAAFQITSAAVHS